MADLFTADNVFNAPLIGQALVDSNGCICAVNDAFARFSRYSAQQLESLPLSSLLYPDSSIPDPGVHKLLRFRSRDGQPLWGSTFILPWKTDSDTRSGFILQVFDKTREQVEQQLNRGRAQVLELIYHEKPLETICEAIVSHIESLGEGMRCSILVLDKERGTLHKAAAPSIPDFYSNAIEGMRIGDGVGSCGTAVFRSERVIVADVLNHPYWAKAKRLVSRTPMRACWSEPIITNGGEVLGSFAIYYDEPREPVAEELDLITSAASLAAIAISYKKNQQVLRDLDRAKDEFISIAAHELRTPITAVIGYTDLLLEETDPSTIRDYASEIAVQGDVLARLVDDLLDVSLIQIGRGLTINMKSTAVEPLVQRVINQLCRSHPDRRIELDCSESVPVRINCDPGRISQVIENLISNALKYSAPEEPVTVQISAADDAVRITVTDNGIGMSDEAVRHAFDKFYRADYSYTAPRGLGMGLCIAQRIVDAHGGEITLKSRPGEGTTVSFTLPLQ